MRIECPICEYQIDLDPTSDLSTPMTCGSCNKSFAFSPDLVIQPTQKIPTDAILKPTLPAAKIIPSPEMAPSVHSDPAQPRSGKTTYRRKNRKLKQGLVVGLLGICTLVLVGLIIYSGSIRDAITGRSETADLTETTQIEPEPLVEKREARELDDSQNQTDPMPPLALRATGSETGLLDQTATPEKPPETEPTIEYAEPKPRIFLKKNIDDIWLKVQPHLVELTAETSFGSTPATGILIDSRGWVLTSYRAIQGAKEISVSPSRKSIQDPPGELTDLVRGVIASDPEHDLAILKVNRRFVISLRELTIVDEDRVVGSQHLIQCVPPTSQYQWPAAECRIENRKTTSKLDESQQQHLDRIGYRDADLRWMLHRGQSPLNGGGALVNENGDLVGMTVKSFPQTSSNDLCLAIPASYIHDLKQNATDTTTPLPLPELDHVALTTPAETGQAKSEPDMESVPVTSSNDGLDVLPKDSLRRPLSLALNRAGQKCGAFGWWPTSDEQAADIQQFVDQLVTARRVIMAEPDDKKEVPTLQKQLDYWWEKFSAGFQPADGLSEETKSQLNRRYENEMQKETAKFVGFGKVYYGAIVSPPFKFDNEPIGETITFQLAGTQQLVLAKASQDWPVLRPGAKCLILGELIPGSILINDDDGNGEKCDLARVYFLIDLDP